MRTALLYDKQDRRTQPVVWHYRDIRPDMIKAAELAPIEKAERRVLALANPGLGLENVQATPSIFIGLQLILPGETAPPLATFVYRYRNALRVLVIGIGLVILVALNAPTPLAVVVIAVLVVIGIVIIELLGRNARPAATTAAS